MGLKDNQVFPMERITVARIQGRTNTRQNCSRVDAALKENSEFFGFSNIWGPFAQAIGRNQSKELKFFTKPKIGLQINQSTAWRGLGRPGATVQLGMSSTTSTASSSTWTTEYLSPRKLHIVLYIKGGICVQKNDTQFPRVST